MILAVDIGNSNIVIGGMEQENVLFQFRLPTDADITPEEYSADVKSCLEKNHVDPTEVEGAIISSVVPQVQYSMETVIREITGKSALVVGPGLKTGFEVKLDDPTQIGADLVVAAVAVLQEYKTPVIVIDMGTATTVTVLDQNGAFLGGSICPGVGISLDALTDRTALLPDIHLEPPKQAIGRNTLECMRSGLVLGNACMLDGLVQRMEEELGSKATVVATGGIAGFVVPLCRTPMIYDKDLLLKGLALLYRENTRD